MVFDQFADTRRSIHVRNDLEQEVWRLQRSLNRIEICLTMLVTHASGRDAYRTVVECADQRVDLCMQAGTSQFLRKSPKFASAGNRGMIIQEHAVRVSAPATSERYWDNLTTFGVVAETGGIRHSNELKLDERLIDLERFGHDRSEPLTVGSVSNHHEFSVDEPIWTRRISWIG